MAKYKLIKEFPNSPDLGTITEFPLGNSWDEYWELVKEPEVKAGDIVVLVKHRTGSSYESKIGEIGTIKAGCYKDFLRINRHINNKSGNWYVEDVRLATKEEIQKSEEVKINGYILEMNNGLAEFGCQSFTKSELQAYKKLLRDPINAKLNIGSTIINTELLDKIIARF